jgi:RHS repeat-associated protein
MLLPGRYVSDTSRRCMTISKSNWTTVLVDTCISAYSLASAVSTTGTASSSTNGGNLVLTAPEASDMLVLTQNVVAGVSNTIQLDINRLTGANDNGVQVVIVEEINNVEYVIGSGYLHQGSKQSLNFTPTIDVAKLKIYGPFDEMLIATTCTKKAKTVQHTYLVDVCDEDKDRYRFGFNGAHKDNELKGVGNSLDFGERIYDPRIGVWLSLDPLQANYPAWSPYNFSLNNPILLKDPDGREPTKAQSGTISGFVTTINTTGTKLGLKKGQEGHKAMLSMGETGGFFKHGRPMPINTQRINTFKDKYIYTEKGGWIDMAHFMFYAGRAYDVRVKKEDAEKRIESSKKAGIRYHPTSLLHSAKKDPVGEAVQEGYHQEMSDRIFAKHSAYSYEDLPSDYFGADFGANYFDPNSKLSFGEQLTNYFDNVLGATDPQNAPNYNDMPATDEDMGEKPSKTNHTTKPMYINDEK